MGSFKKPSYFKKEDRRIGSTFPEFQEELGLKTFAAEAYEKFFYEYKKRKEKGGDEKILTSPEFLAKKLNCSIRSAWGIFKRYVDAGFAKISKTSNIEVRDGCLLNYSVTLLKFPKSYQKNTAIIAENHETIAENRAIAANGKSPSTVMEKGLIPGDQTTNILQLYTYNINPLTPLSCKIKFVENKNSHPAPANASAREKIKNNQFEIGFLEKPEEIQPIICKPEGLIQPQIEEIPKKPKRRRLVNAQSTDQFEQWYTIYPRHVEPDEGQRAFMKVLKKVTFEELLERTKIYAKLRKEITDANEKEKTYTPYPASWLNGGQWKNGDINTIFERNNLKQNTESPGSKTIAIESKSAFDKKVKKKLFESLGEDKYKSWIVGSDFEAIGLDDGSDEPVFKTNSRFCEDYIQTNFAKELQEAFLQADNKKSPPPNQRNVRDDPLENLENIYPYTPFSKLINDISNQYRRV